MKKTILKYRYSIITLLLFISNAVAATASTPWGVNPNDFQYDMSLYFEISFGEEKTDYSQYDVAVFCGEECRGVAEILSLGNETEIYYLRARSNKESGETMTFKYHNKETEEIEDINVSFEFESNGRLGYPSAPFKIYLSVSYNVILKSGVGGTIDHNGGKIAPNTELTVTATPAEGYHFEKWSDGVVDNPRTIVVNCDTSLTAEFKANCYKLTYKIDGNIYKEYDINYCDSIIPIVAPTKAGYTFSGWDSIPTTMPAHDITINGTFIADYINWTFDEATGTLTISGSGAMTDYEFGTTPWYEVQESIKMVIIEDGVTSIGQAAFAHCYGLTGVTIPNSVTNIGEDAFRYCSNLTSIVINEGNSVYDSRENCNAIIKTSTNELIQGCKNTIIPNSVTTIGEHAFSLCSDLTSITIPNSVTTIREYAFSNCSDLTSITIPNSVTTIGEAAFVQCEGLTSVTIPNSITTIGFQAFDACNNIVNITSYIPIDGLFPISVHTFGEVDKDSCTLYVPAGAKATYAATDGWKEFTNIVEMEEEKNFCGDSAYWTFDEATGTLTISGVGTMYYFPYSNYVPWAKHRKNVRNVVIEEGITEIGRYAFWEFCCLKEITIPKGITSIGEYALSHCDSLVHITVEDGNSVYDSRDICNAIIETETNKLVAGCKNTIIPQSVTALASCAFQGCVGLEQITIPKHINQIGNCAFSHCADLAEIKVEDGNTTYDSRNNCNGIIETETNRLIAGCKNTIIPGSVTSIDGAFSGCTELTKIVIPNSITSIGDYSFDYSGLTSVTLPQGIQSIGKWAFDMCSSLTSINSHIPAEKLFAIDVSVFRNVDKDSCTLYVPEDSKATYAATNGWNEFTNIVEINPEISISVDSISTTPGRSITLPFGMANSEAVTAFQIDLELPEGIEFVSATLSDERKTTTHYLDTSVLANNKRRIIAYSTNNSPFKLNEGTLLNINLDVAKDIENGDYKLNISNIRMVMPNSNEILLDPISANINVKLLMGDANDDNDVTMGDVVSVANYILELLFGAFNFDAADINGDGEITMGDLVAIINIILYPEDYDYGRNAKRGMMAANGTEISLPDTRSTDEAVSVPVSLSSTMAYTAFQMDIELPEGAKLASATASERAAGHSVAWSCLPDGKMRVVAYSLDNEVFSGNAGELVALNIEAEGAVSGAISVENVRMVTPSGAEYAIGNCGSLLDINGTTGINGTEAGSLKVYTADGALIVESGKAMKAAVYSVSGKLVKTLDVAEGKNVFDGIPAGTYVVAGVKVAIK